MRRFAHSMLCASLLVLLTANATAAEDSIALRCGSMLDVVSGKVRGPATIVTRGGRIESIDAGTPAGTISVDLTALTCLPGLIDLHAHILINPETPPHSDLERSSAARALDGLHNAQVMLEAGFTTLRDPGDYDRYYATVAIRNAIAAGRAIGPRLFVAPHVLGPTGGHGDFNSLAGDLSIEAPTRTADGVDEIRRVIREEVKYGADWIKVMATGGVISSGDNPNLAAYTDDELRAAVDETHRLGRKITVHAIGTVGTKAAVKAGVDCVEHGALIDDETIALMKQRGTWLVPTLYVLDYVIDSGPQMGMSAQSVTKARNIRDQRDEHLRRAFAAGVKIAFGSDTIFPHGDAAREFAELVRLGLSPIEAIRAATINSAQVLGIADQVGSLEQGKVADIVAVRTNPLGDIRALEHVAFVMKAGHIIRSATP
jgi:imidazolonepropionase-like amidohydrolase